MIGLPELVAGVMVLALNAYAVLGGADFGGGVWDLLATGPRKDAQRAHIAGSIAPIWEANHVWLIVVLVVLFTGFPKAFSALTIVLHVPLTLALLGIVLRGSAFVFRSYGSSTPEVRNRWGLAFAVASTITPIVLGAIVGSLASGTVGRATQSVGHASFAAVFLAPWLGAFPLTTGLFALALFAFLAAVYLAHGAADEALREDFRRKALGAGVAVFVLAFTALGLAAVQAPSVARDVAGTSVALALQAVTALAAVAAFWALWTRRHGLARVAAAAQVSFILWGWAWSQLPFVVPGAFTIRSAAAGSTTLELLLLGLLGGSAILVPALWYLFRLFAQPGTRPG